MSCAACKNAANPNDSLTCCLCKERYHSKCVCMPSGSCDESSKDFVIKWYCPSCKSKQPKVGNLNTPVRSTSDSQVSEDVTDYVTTRKKKRPTYSPPQSKNAAGGGCNCVSMDSLREIIRSEIRDTINACLDDRLNLRLNSHLKDLRADIASCKDSMSFISDKFDELKSEYSAHCQNIKSLMKDNETLRTTVLSLSNRLNQMDQLTRASNLEIQCVPQHDGENLVTLASQLGRIIDCPIKDGDIAYCTRTAKFDNKSSRPRSILVKFTSPRLRDSVLAATTQFNKKNPSDKLSSKHLGIGGKKTPVFVVENLSPEYKQLHAAARKRATEQNYKYVWVRGGRIYMRKSDASEAVNIRDLSCLSRLQ